MSHGNNKQSVNGFINIRKTFKPKAKKYLPLQAGDVPKTYADVDDLIRMGFKPDGCR